MTYTGEDDEGIDPRLVPFLSQTPEVKVVDMTPELAEVLLASSPGNRVLRKYMVEKYARDMRNGDWHETAETIQVSKSGRLKNGHHRLYAVIESGVTIRFYVAIGLEEDVDRFVDTGTARTGADAFKMADFHPDPQMCAAVSVLALNVEAGVLPRVELFKQGGGSSRWSRAETLNWGEVHRDQLQDAVARFGAGARKPSMKGMSPAAWVYALFVLRQLDGERVDEFAEGTVQMRTNGRGDPRNSLLTYLQERSQILNRKGIPFEKIHSMRAPEALYIIFKAYNAWANARTITAANLAPANGADILYPTIPESRAA